MSPVWVRLSASAVLARPKSATQTLPWVSSRRFEGLTSRWTMPWRLACSRASATWMPIDDRAVELPVGIRRRRQLGGAGQDRRGGIGRRAVVAGGQRRGPRCRRARSWTHQRAAHRPRTGKYGLDAVRSPANLELVPVLGWVAAGLSLAQPIEPAPRLLAMSQAVMGHRQERSRPGRLLLAPGAGCLLLQMSDRLLPSPAGART